MVVEVNFRVVGEEKMRCSGCEMRARFALSRRPGVQEVWADSKTQRIAVVINPTQVTLEDVQVRLRLAELETAARASLSAPGLDPTSFASSC